MPITLVSCTELNAALQRLQIIDVGGEKHVDGRELLATLTTLTGLGGADSFPTGAPVLPSREQLGIHPENAAELPIPVPPELHVDPIEFERRRLAALPPGPCFGCKHIEHVDGACVDCNCVDYVDSVVRDPIEAVGDAIQAGRPVDPVLADAVAAALRSGPHGGPPHTGLAMVDEDFLARPPMRWGGGENINPEPPTPQLPTLPE